MLQDLSSRCCFTAGVCGSNPQTTRREESHSSRLKVAQDRPGTKEMNKRRHRPQDASRGEPPERPRGVVDDWLQGTQAMMAMGLLVIGRA